MPPISPDSRIADLPNIALLGFGEAGSAFATGWLQQDACVVRAYDIKTKDPALAPNKNTEYLTVGVEGCTDIERCITGADAVFSLVTADQALAAVQNASAHINKGQLYLDCNSCAPDTKRQASALINQAGGHYVDVAVVAPVHPALHRAPILVSGEYAKEALALMKRLDMSANMVAGDIGAASSIKMIRSVMMKGLEALMAECVLAGEKAGCADVVLDSLEKTFPGFNWETRSSYALERMMVHGKRRAAEMREVALTIEQLGLNNGMSRATIDWQQAIGDLQLAAKEDDYHIRANTIITALDNRELGEK